MTGFRIPPTDSFVHDVVSIFLSKPNLGRVQEIHLGGLKKETIIAKMIELFPTLQMYYYPCKIASLVTFSGGKPTFTFDSCIRVLRQVLRKRGYSVQTKNIRKHRMAGRVIVVIPSSLSQSVSV